MTQTEKEESLQKLSERQFELLAVMKSSDDHAAKCMKLGLKFKTQYPDEYTAYEAARTEYNENEVKIAELEAAEAESEEATPTAGENSEDGQEGDETTPSDEVTTEAETSSESENSGPQTEN
jgi:hypothetical protein